MRFLGIQNCEVDSFSLYETLLRDLDVSFDSFHAYRGEPLPPLSAYDAILVGGTPVAAYAMENHPFLVAEEEYLRLAIRAGRPCLGICFGAQLMAKVLGGDVRRAMRKEIGVYELELTSAGKVDPLLESFPLRFPVFQWHGETFDVPAGAELLVTGAGCQNQMFRRANAVGIQFHLEVRSEAAAWARAYSDELRQFGKASHDLLYEVRAHEQQITGLAAKLLENFVRWAERWRAA
jgi:GMP synthase-like glutamine amidotransferase